MHAFLHHWATLLLGIGGVLVIAGFIAESLPKLFWKFRNMSLKSVFAAKISFLFGTILMVLGATF